MMKNSERSTKSRLIALLVLVIFSLLITVGLRVIGERLDDYIELRARCKSLGGEMGSDKCFKNGKEI